MKAGQTVKHLHFHLLGGRSLQWAPRLTICCGFVLTGSLPLLYNIVV
ncbi:HIT domain-containing protein [Selenomonas ruminantium]